MGLLAAARASMQGGFFNSIHIAIWTPLCINGSKFYGGGFTKGLMATTGSTVEVLQRDTLTKRHRIKEGSPLCINGSRFHLSLLLFFLLKTTSF